VLSAVTITSGTLSPSRSASAGEVTTCPLTDTGQFGTALPLQRQA
jgi:hypothetical protein